MDSFLGLTDSEVKVVSDGTLTKEELSSVTGSGSNSKKKANNLAKPALSDRAKLRVRTSAKKALS